MQCRVSELVALPLGLHQRAHTRAHACMHACMRVCARVMTLNTEHGTGARDGQLEMADLEHKRSDTHRNQVQNLSLKSVVMPLKQQFSSGGCAPQPRLEWPGHPSQRNSARYKTGPPDRALNLGAVRTATTNTRTPAPNRLSNRYRRATFENMRKRQQKQATRKIESVRREPSNEQHIPYPE